MIDALFAKIAGDRYLGDLAARSMDDLRALRAECQRVEDAVSYQRRLVQGRLDILKAERARRAAGAPPADLEAIVAGLPGTLAAGVAGPRRGHTTYEHELADVGDVTATVDGVVGPAELADLPGLPADTLESLTDRLAALEHDVSARRRVVFDRLDALADEVGRRYRNGGATVDKLVG